jgi:hypothetical protein
VSPITLLIAVVVALVVMIPARRLQLAGWSRDSVITYFGVVWLLGVVVAVVPAPTRFLVPMLLVAYLAPFITIRAGIDRLFRGQQPSAPVEPERPQMKNVTPPEPSEPSERPGEPPPPDAPLT